MRRVAIVGPGGSGKSTFARALGAKTGLPVVHLDEHFWSPGWVEPTSEEWRATQSDLVAEPEWIMDGNYGGTADLRIPVADTLIMFARPRVACMVGLLRRRFQRGGAPPQAEGCRERLTLDFLRYVWTYPTAGRQRMLRHLEQHRHENLEVIEFRRRRDATESLNQLGEQ